MAKGKTKKKVLTKERKELLDLTETPGVIDTYLSLNTIGLAGLKWHASLEIRSILPRSYHLYTIKLVYDFRPGEKRIDEIERSLNDSLFAADKAERKKLEQKVKVMYETLRKEAAECDPVEFGATVEALRYKDGGTTLNVRIPDDVIVWFNKHKHQMPMYRVLLIPIFDEPKK